MDRGAIQPGGHSSTCKAALEEDPTSATLKAWLGCAYDATGDEGGAAPLLEEAAAGGNPVAQTLYDGDMLIVGDAVGQDMTRGAELLQLAAEAGFAPAMGTAWRCRSTTPKACRRITCKPPTGIVPPRCSACRAPKPIWQ